MNLVTYCFPHFRICFVTCLAAMQLNCSMHSASNMSFRLAIWYVDAIPHTIKKFLLLIMKFLLVVFNHHHSAICLTECHICYNVDQSMCRFLFCFVGIYLDLIVIKQYGMVNIQHSHCIMYHLLDTASIYVVLFC